MGANQQKFQKWVFLAIISTLVVVSGTALMSQQRAFKPGKVANYFQAPQKSTQRAKAASAVVLPDSIRKNVDTLHQKQVENIINLDKEADQLKAQKEQLQKIKENNRSQDALNEKLAYQGLQLDSITRENDSLQAELERHMREEHVMKQTDTVYIQTEQPRKKKKLFRRE